MANAWGGAWGTSWGVSWGSGVTPPSPPTAFGGTGGLLDEGEIERQQRRREKAERADKERLRRIIERAVRKANGEPEPSEASQPVKPAPAPRPAIVRAVRSELKLDGIKLSLHRIEQLLAEYAKQMEDDAMMEIAIVFALVA